jgi:hypothetical protein
MTGIGNGMAYTALALIDTRLQKMIQPMPAWLQNFCPLFQTSETFKRGTSGDDLTQRLQPNMIRG